MSAVVGVLPSVALFLNGWIFASLVLSLFCLAIAVVKLIRGRFVAAAAVGLLFVAFATVFTASSLLAPSSSWQVMYAVYDVSPPNLKIERRNDIAERWLHFHEEIRLLDWYLLARKWGVCHELWEQRSCTKVPPNREAEGIARELLTKVASGG